MKSRPVDFAEWRHQRVAGGIRITLDELGMTSTALLTQDPLVVNSIMQRLGNVGVRATQLQRELVARRIQSVTELDSRLSAAGHVLVKAPRWLESSASALQLCDTQIAANDYPAACQQASLVV